METVTIGATVTTNNNPSMPQGKVTGVTEFGFFVEYSGMYGGVTLYWTWADITEYALVVN